MTFARLLVLFSLTLLVAVGLTVTPASAQSCDACDSASFPHPSWLGYYGSPYSLGQIPVPPYFSLHPPVYYSYPVPRSYGYSPYAYPGTVRTPEIVTSEPEMIENPHVEQDMALPTTQTASWQVIVNPYVDQVNSPRRELAVR